MRARRQPAPIVGLTLPPVARASIVERVVAVVGERPILLTELQHRAHPFRGRIYGASSNQAQVAAQESDLYRHLLQRMIEDQLEEHAAGRAHLSVTPEEIDNAIKTVAKGNGLQPAALIAEALREGLTEQDYRDELRRQVLEGKLVQLRVRGRVRVTEQDGRAAFDRWLKETGDPAQAEVRILAMRVPPGASPADVSARRLVAEDIVTRTRGGEDFCRMVAQYSDDQATLATCGSHGPLAVRDLLPEVQTAIQGLKPGELSSPISSGSPSVDQAILIVQLVSAPRVPGYDDVKDNMMERAFGEAMERQRRVWLDELRRGVYINSRL